MIGHRKRAQVIQRTLTKLDKWIRVEAAIVLAVGLVVLCLWGYTMAQALLE